MPAPINRDLRLAGRQRILGKQLSKKLKGKSKNLNMTTFYFYLLTFTFLLFTSNPSVFFLALRVDNIGEKNESKCKSICFIVSQYHFDY